MTKTTSKSFTLKIGDYKLRLSLIWTCVILFLSIVGLILQIESDGDRWRKYITEPYEKNRNTQPSMSKVIDNLQGIHPLGSYYAKLYDGWLWVRADELRKGTNLKVPLSADMRQNRYDYRKEPWMKQIAGDYLISIFYRKSCLIWWWKIYYSWCNI